MSDLPNKPSASLQQGVQATLFDDTAFAETDAASVLSAGFPDDMVIVDCETTGGKPGKHRIIEIGLLRVRQGEVIERWSTLINPYTVIPTFIQNLTGIRNDDVQNAPGFLDIAQDLQDKLQGAVFVAHNARFDYAFIKQEFLRAGIEYNAKTLCSVRVSRTLFPQFKRHGLDAIITRFDLSMASRHRAMDDALAVYDFFLKCSEIHQQEAIQSVCRDLLKRHALPPLLTQEMIDALPNTPGVYYFYDQDNTLLYVGKSVQIRHRVMSHFNQDYRNAKDLAMNRSVAFIDFTETPSDFGALLLESSDVKRRQPLHNKRLRKLTRMYQCQLVENESGFLVPTLTAVRLHKSLLDAGVGLYRSQRAAEKHFEKLAEHYFLCHRLLGLESVTGGSTGGCFRAQLKKCLGACCGQETPEAYNQRVAIAFNQYQQKVWPWQGPVVVIERSQHCDDFVHFHLIDRWRYVKRLTSLTSADELEGYDTLGEPNDKFGFDLDQYYILLKYLLPEANPQSSARLHVVPLERLTQGTLP